LSRRNVSADRTAWMYATRRVDRQREDRPGVAAPGIGAQRARRLTVIRAPHARRAGLQQLGQPHKQQ
jgi:hypothetical protein